MPIKQGTLRRAALHRRSGFVAKSINEARVFGKQTAFLCHSHKDRELAEGLANLLNEAGWNLYIDWSDEGMPDVPDAVTASRIKEKIGEVNWFLFLATDNSKSSRWCPWEIGYADAKKAHSKILIIPTEREDGSWYGNEYLQLYRRLDEGTSPGKSGYAVFDPGVKNQGIWVEDLRRGV